MSDEPTTRAGFCALLGLPNVGKSTLMNRVLGKRLVAVSAKPETTRNRIVGVKMVTSEIDGVETKTQIAYVDTPGLQDGRGALRRFMRDETTTAAGDCDVALLVIDATDRRGRNPGRLHDQDAQPLAAAIKRVPTVIALNKIDKVAKPDLLPLMEAWAAVEAHGPVDVIPIAALHGDGVERVEQAIAARMAPGPHLFPEDMVTDRAESFLAGELIREQLYHQLGKELPYAAGVVIEKFEERPGGDVAIGAIICVERDSQKAIVVGKGGARIKELGIAAREAVTELFACPVHISLHVKVVPDWTHGGAGLIKLGYQGKS
ncbi:MAG: GTPase Era [Deltaproteobacteria bacterium]|nr:GTPase Era [Deltaproteobacteria bacterium]